MFKFQTKFYDALPGNKIPSNYPQSTPNSCYTAAQPTSCQFPKLVLCNSELAEQFGLDNILTQSKPFLDIVTGNLKGVNCKPYAMCYGGHQFGHWAGQLGDGRAINLGEINTEIGLLHLQLKGAGRTAYSRTADGLAVLRSSVREYLCSEALHSLGIPTHRALSLAITGNDVMRDKLYNGEPAFEPGAIVSRVSKSFIRFGNFEITRTFSDHTIVKSLVDYVIQNHFAALDSTNTSVYEMWFESVVNKTAFLMAQWQRVGFVHGVMNTDNMSIIGETIDLGPYGWLDEYDPNFTPNTTDLPHKRYRYSHQPSIAQWNLQQLGAALPAYLISKECINENIEKYNSLYANYYIKNSLDKLGLVAINQQNIELIDSVLQTIYDCKLDYTLFYRTLANVDIDSKIEDDYTQLINHSYLEIIEPQHKEKLLAIVEKYKAALLKENRPTTIKKDAMNGVNPSFVLRNYITELANTEALQGDYTLLNELSQMLKTPYSTEHEQSKWFSKRPEWARNKFGCSMLSCSS